MNESKNEKHITDSLYVLVKKSNGKEKLETYSTLIQFLLNNADTAKCHKVIDEYINEALNQKNIAEQCLAKKTELDFFYRYDRRRFNANYDSFMLFAEKHKQWKLYFNIFTMRMYQMLQLHQTLQVLNETEAMYKFAKENNNIYGLGTSLTIFSKIYINEHNYNEAERSIKEAINYFQKISSYDDQLSSYKILLFILKHQKKYKEIEQLLQKITQNSAEENQINNENNFFIDLEYAVLYTHTENYRKATQYFTKIAGYLNQKSPFHREAYNHRLMELCIRQGKYSIALDILDTLTAFHRQQNNNNIMLDIMSNRIYLLGKLGHGNEAADLLKQYEYVKDSINDISINTKLNELRILYDLDKLVMKNQKSKQLVIFLCVIIFIFLLFIVSFIINQINMNKKNKVIVKHILDNKVKIIDKNKDDFYRNIFDNFNALLEKSNFWRSQNISSKELCKQLNTNQEYLRQTINYCASMGISEYITNYRLEKSIIILMETDKNSKMEQIAFDCGFNSISTFYRQFKQKYNITPQQFRKEAFNNKKFSKN